MTRLETQQDWDVGKLHGRWPSGPDNVFMLDRLKELTVDVTAAGARGRVVEIAASEAILSCLLNARGLESFALEPSRPMLEKARQRMSQYCAQVHLVCGIAEILPFRDQAFDRVLCDSAIDHFADPELAVREMARILAPSGRMIIGAVNYKSPTVRASRMIYELQRRFGHAAPGEHFFWDTPVPIEHTFECSYDLLQRLCRPYLDLVFATGVSIGWMFPGWGPLLGRMSPARATRLLRHLDSVARRWPQVADYVLTVWQPRNERPHIEPASGSVPGTLRAASPPAKAGQPGSLTYEIRIGLEEAYWSSTNLSTFLVGDTREGEHVANTIYSGNPNRPRLIDWASPGPFRQAAVFGGDISIDDLVRLSECSSEKLDIDVYDLSPVVIRRARKELRRRRHAAPSRLGRVRFVQADLNVVRLPKAAYDVIWSIGCTHYILSLEHLFAEVEGSLRDDGLFAFHAYVGERRLQYEQRRLDRVNAALRDTPRRFHRANVETISAPRPEQLSPFCAIRSDEILPLARSRFDLVHQAVTAALFPLHLYLDLPAIKAEAPEILARLTAREQEAIGDPLIRGCNAFAVFRRRRRPAAPSAQSVRD